jgi:transposase-like protein
MSDGVLDLVPGLVRGQMRGGRCLYDKSAKEELVRRCLQPGVSVAAMALAHGVNANLVRRWIMLTVRERGTEQPAPVKLLPVLTTTDSSTTVPRQVIPPSDNAIEILLPSGTIRVRGAVEPSALAAVIDCLRQRT